ENEGEPSRLRANVRAHKSSFRRGASAEVVEVSGGREGCRRRRDRGRGESDCGRPTGTDADPESALPAGRGTAPTAKGAAGTRPSSGTRRSRGIPGDRPE